MKRALQLIAIGLGLIVLGFFAGRVFQYLKSGYHFETIDEKEIQSSLGTVEWKCVTESVGMPFLDPSTTIIDFKGRTIFKARRIFQENYPYARNVQVTNDTIVWDDGELKYHLAVEPLTNLLVTPQFKTTN
jgi:hypothetical protein